ncbi:MAG: hypothetical protein IT290_09780, partial [Deltaproteobacteria bacterium]|nr:hypothetical protein [Deltaproteobacteria bacterium]
MSSFSHGSACSPEVGQALFLAELLSESERSLFHFINLAAENNTVAETALSECFITVANDLGSFEDLDRAKIQLFKAAFERIQALQARGESLTVIIELPEGKERISHETLLSYALTRLPLDYKIVFFLTDVVKFSKVE